MSYTESDFTYVTQLLREDAGFILEPDKGYLLEPRLGEVLLRHGLASVSDLVERLRLREERWLRRETLEAMLNNETLFFRDIDCWNALRNRIIPALLTARAHTRTLEIVSLACSTGQEPYSVAMMLSGMSTQLDGFRTSIVATDISAQNLERARRGRYSQFEVNRGLPAAMLLRHFDQEGAAWLLRDNLRRTIEFREANLLSPDWPVDAADVLFLRNVMIYWSPSTRREVLAHAAQILRPGGCLVLGGAETTLGLDDRFERFAADTPCCFRRL